MIHGSVLAPAFFSWTRAFPSAARFDYDLAVPQDARRPLAIAWLGLGLVALLASGLFSVLLVLSRTPQLQALFPVADFFRVALVVHVDLSVLVWFLAFGGALWTMAGTRRLMPMAWGAFALSATGTLAMCASPFVERAVPVMANYVPVLDGPVFLGGLVLFGAGVALLCLRSMLAVEPVGTRISGNGALRFGLNAALVAAAVAAFAFAWSWNAVPRGLDARIYYELVFWGGGHVLQFAYTLLMLVGWLWLASATGARLPLSPRVVTLLFAIALASVFLTPITYLAYDVTSVEHHRAQTLLMRFGGGLVIPPVALAVLWALWPRRALVAEQRPLRNALAASLLLFSAGGAIGFLITGSNVRIPAHYHGCIVGVTLAMMGVVYHLLPRLGYAAPRSKAAAWQPVVYGAGQLMHIVGLVWSGGYGVQRKVAGAEQVLRTTQETLGMGLMGLGGLVAIVGGVMFVAIVLRALKRRDPRGTMAGTPAPGRPLQAIGTAGTVLTLAILGASVLLRLTTVFDAGGSAQSTLPGAIESAVRAVHRIAASGTGLLALAAVILGWRRRVAVPHALRPVAWMAGATLVLAAIGPLTPGYRHDSVTVANVAGGVILLMACWWLREVVAFGRRQAGEALLYTMFAVYVLHTGSGALASALEMRDAHWGVILHAATAILTTMLVLAVLWERRGGAAAVAALLLALQVALGVAAALAGARPLWMGLAHALLSLALACALVSAMVRFRANPDDGPGIA